MRLHTLTRPFYVSPDRGDCAGQSRSRPSVRLVIRAGATLAALLRCSALALPSAQEVGVPWFGVATKMSWLLRRGETAWHTHGILSRAGARGCARGACTLIWFG